MNLGRWVLRNLFLGFIREEQRVQRKLYDHISDASISRGVQRGSAPTHIDFTNKGIQAYRERTLSSSSIKSPGIPYSTIIASPGLIPAVTPNFSSAVRASPLVTPLIQLQSISKEKNLSPIPQSPIGMTSPEDTTPMPMPGPRRAATMDDGPGQHALRESDYFSLRAKQVPMSAAVLATPDEPGGAAAKAEGVPMSPTPQTPSAGGFMGRLKNLGRNASKRAQSESGGASATPGGASAATLSEVRSVSTVTSFGYLMAPLNIEHDYARSERDAACATDHPAQPTYAAVICRRASASASAGYVADHLRGGTTELADDVPRNGREHRDGCADLGADDAAVVTGVFASKQVAHAASRKAQLRPATISNEKPWRGSTSGAFERVSAAQRGSFRRTDFYALI